MISLYERDLVTNEIVSQTYDDCARAVAFCIYPNQTITETGHIEFKQRHKSCNALKSKFCKSFLDEQE